VYGDRQYAVPMPNAVVLLVYLLAVARVVRLVTTDRVTQRPRDWIITHLWIRHWLPSARAEQPGETRGEHRRMAAGFAREFRASAVPPLSVYLMTCPWCVSIYAGAVAAPIIWFWGTSPWLAVPALALALSQGTGLIASKGE
jgi:hypothetical protein